MQENSLFTLFTEKVDEPPYPAPVPFIVDEYTYYRLGIPGSQPSSDRLFHLSAGVHWMTFAACSEAN
ncbi:hypothetical protein AVEN_194782-1 [Araneus ventricosus]|uniref:Uncharacterized protein n=1 Tax=Araneus ventricosus TaxID=182803 RepID=A0A4Y2B4Y5_ARAVE|nr:hypothetical protein AVEN_194782-1 [Araneus ventricosus]